MRVKRGGRIAWCTFVVSLYALVVTWSVTCIQAAKSPTVATTEFANIPAKVSYFEDSSVVLWHDAQASTVYRSDNEGKTWAPVKGPAERAARYLIEHPYDTKQAFILSDTKEHWRTRDRGATWQKFLTPEPPAVRAGSPLDFHADPQHRNSILFTGRRCSEWSPWQGSVCHDIVYYTTDAFATDAKPAMEVVLHCSWAKTTRELEIPTSAIQRIFCIAWDESSQENTPSGNQGTSKTRLYESDDFFKTKRLVDLGIGRDARGFMGLGASRRYLITAIQAPSGAREMSLYVSTNGVHWQKAQFPHGEVLHENAYTILEGPRFHLLVDVLDATTNVGSLFMSDASGTNFTLSLKGTQRNPQGVVDYEHLANIDGVAIANVRKEIYIPSRIQTELTYDEGSHWTHLQAPSKDVDGRPIGCDVYDTHRCALHLHALMQPHNAGRVFSSSAPGLVMGVGNVGDSPRPYAECDTFLSEDAGKTWRMVARHPHKYEFGDQGGLLVMTEDKESVNEVKYSFNYGRTWSKLPLGTSITPYALTTIPDSTALKFLIVGAKSRETSHLLRKQVAMFLDFAPIQKRKCTASDFEKWYATGTNGKCILGHKQWYMRRRPDADCLVLEKFHDPQGHEDACECTQFDYECDFNFVARNSQCEPAKPIPIPAGACHQKSDKFLSPSGYRKVPGNSCIVPSGKRALDAPVMRSCSEASFTPELGTIHHQQFQFPALIADVLHFERSPHVVVRLEDGQVYQSSDDGSTWHELKLYVTRFAEERALALVPHAHDRQRAFILSGSQAVFYTTDGGAHWEWFTAPLLPNTLGLPVLDFHLTHPEWLLWTGSRDCHGAQRTGNCHTEAFYSVDNGAHWKRFDTYVRKCAWLLNKQFQAADSRAILCESYREKQGEQASQHTGERVLQLVLGNDLYRKKQVLFSNVLGFSVFEQYLLVAEVVGGASSLTMQVSMDAAQFAAIQLPPQLELAHHAFTVLDSVTQAVFMHVSTQLASRREWGELVKSNSNGTYYTLSLPNVNRDAFGYVDFEKMQGIDGIALVNVVGNPQDAALTGQKQLQTRISHNDGGHWTDLTPPAVDALGNAYACNQVGCNLHLHNVLERPDVKMMTSNPAATGFMVGIGNVGRSLAKYTDCDTFLTRDAGFTWEEVHKDAHKWAYGDHGAILLLVDDESPTDQVLYTLDQGATWKSYKLEQRMRIITIDAVPEDTKRRFVLFGHTDQVQPVALAIFLDLNAAMPRECVFDSDATKSDFERWSPSEQREETCLFGARRWYWRRKRDRICYVGDKVPEQPMELEKCLCSDADFECEFNHFRDPETHQCIAYPNMKPLTADIDAQCAPDAPDYDGYWYERTNMRRIPISMCQGGARFDRGTQHRCPHTPIRHGLLWWISVLLIAGGFGFALAYWYTRGDLQQLGAVRLIEENAAMQDIREQLGLLRNLATGFLSLVWARFIETLDKFPMLRNLFTRNLFTRSQPDRPFSSYYMLSTDEDAEILHDYDSDELPPP
ncbi:vacuolar protein sorting/targeting protein PEP1 [Malassezia psittaci]|uniref:Vacuolar protein sorting/targeting protein PEP1 n=1 Tax=Malassezia psittaci TaxID=1821823 RepID=A0AAF0FDM3_9BASI|nr:vacuolar protein sorting/targeting protein PEP1 [Malassezia psittaci]